MQVRCWSCLLLHTTVKTPLAGVFLDTTSEEEVIIPWPILVVVLVSKSRVIIKVALSVAFPIPLILTLAIKESSV